MGECLCSYLEEPTELGCGNLQLFGDVIDNESLKFTADIRPEEVVNWKSEDPFLIYDLPRSIDESTLPGNRNSKRIMDTQPSKPIENWESEDILRWICDEYSRSDRDYERVPLRKFRRTSIFELRDMQIHDFFSILGNQDDAEFLFNCKTRLFASCKNKKVKRIEDWDFKDIMEWICETFDANNRDYEQIPLRNFRGVTIREFKQMSLEYLHRLLGNWDAAQLLYNCKNDLFGGTSYNNQTFYTPHQQVNTSLEVNNNFYDNSMPQTTTNVTQNKSNVEPVRIRKRGRPRTKEVHQVKNEVRTGKLWEFLRNLLMDSKTCPSLIKWENYEERMFKFVQNEKVAKMWGDRKKNGKMNYEKFSRAMRYYYRNKILLPVSGKRLVYKFGPNATGWRDVKPIL